MNDKLEDLEARVRRLEDGLGKVIAVLQKEEKFSTSPTPPPVYAAPSSSLLNPPAPRSPGNALGIIAAIFFIMAAAFFVKLAVEAGWLTPIRQFGITLLFGSALVVSGWIFKKRDSEYSSVLPASGVVVLNLAVYAGQFYWRLFGSEISLVLITLVSIVALALFYAFRHPIFVGLAAAGSYLVPLLFDIIQPYISVSTYFFAWDATFIILAILLRERIFLILASYLAILSYGIFASFYGNLATRSDHQFFALIFQGGQFFIFLIAHFYYTIRTKKPLSGQELNGSLAFLILFYGLEYEKLHQFWPDFAPWIALGFAAALLFLSHTAKRLLAQDAIASTGIATAFGAIVFYHAFYLQILTSDLQPYFALLLLVLWKLFYKRVRPIGAGIVASVPMLVGILVIVTEAGTIFMEGLKNRVSGNTVVLLLLFAAALFVKYVTDRNEEDPKSKDRTMEFFVLGLASAYILMGTRHILIQLYTGFEPSFGVSGVWAFYALLILIWARSAKDRLMARVSLAIFGLVSVKVFFIDLANATTVARIISLVLIGAILYAGGLVYRQLQREI